MNDFDRDILLSVESLGDKAYPAEISRQMTRTLERHVAISEVLLSLEKAEDRRHVESTHVGDRKLFILTDEGAEMARSMEPYTLEGFFGVSAPA